MLDAALCHSHSQYTLLSISIITALQGLEGRKEREKYTRFVRACVCVCLEPVTVAAFVSKKDRKEMRLYACVVVFFSALCA